jgi:preprotein translocase subunit SecG
MEDLKEIIIVLSAFFILTTFTIGAISTRQNTEGCEYNSIASVITIPHVIGCELFKQRWKK